LCVLSTVWGARCVLAGAFGAELLGEHAAVLAGTGFGREPTNLGGLVVGTWGRSRRRRFGGWGLPRSWGGVFSQLR
jgi:hypothetical protein